MIRCSRIAPTEETKPGLEETKPGLVFRAVFLPRSPFLRFGDSREFAVFWVLGVWTGSIASAKGRNSSGGQLLALENFLTGYRSSGVL